MRASGPTEGRRSFCGCLLGNICDVCGTNEEELMSASSEQLTQEGRSLVWGPAASWNLQQAHVSQTLAGESGRAAWLWLRPLLTEVCISRVCVCVCVRSLLLSLLLQFNQVIT